MNASYAGVSFWAICSRVTSGMRAMEPLSGAGADEEHVDTRHRHHLRQVLDGLDLFEHQAHERLAIGVLDVVRRRALEAVARGPAAAEDAAVTVRRVLHGVHGGPRFVGGVDV